MRLDMGQDFIGQGHFQDTGCELAPTCLACPFPQCRFDYPGGNAAFLRKFRDEDIRAQAAKGEPPLEIGRKHRLSERTVYRIIAMEEQP